MKPQNSIKLIALLRGINVGGKHKVPMAELRREMENLGFSKVTTLLNSGNVIFETQQTADIESGIKARLENVFGFAIPVLLRNFEEISAMAESDPFKNIKINENIRLYVTFLKNEPKNELALPYLSKDESFRIIEVSGKTVFSVLDLSRGNTVKGMDDLEQLFGKDVTTRNWNTILKLSQK